MEFVNHKIFTHKSTSRGAFFVSKSFRNKINLYLCGCFKDQNLGKRHGLTRCI